MTTFPPLALRILHSLHLSLAYLSLIFLLLAAVYPFHNAFLFSLLFSWNASSIIIAFFVYSEHVAATKSTLSQSYFLYQVLKIGTVSVMYGIGFGIWCNTTYHSGRGKIVWVEELCKGSFGFRKMPSGELRIHATVLWMHALNWVLLCAAFSYSAFIPGMKEGQIRLDDNVEVPADSGRAEEGRDDEAIATSST